MAKPEISPAGRPKIRNGRLLMLTPAVTQAEEATAITLSSLPNQYVAQRVGTSKDVSVSGTLAGPAGTVIEARVVDATSNTEVVGWVPAAQSAADGTYKGSIRVPQGGWYKMQVRAAGSSSVVASDPNKFGVGVLVGLFGQSNMVNFMSTANQYPLGHPKAIQFDNGVYKRLGNTKDTLPPNTLNGTSGYPSKNNVGTNADGPVYLANMIAMELGIPVALVYYAAGGSAISQWMTGQTNWTNFANRVIAAGGDIEVAIWYQGESNARSTSQAAMQTGWNNLLNQCLALTGRTTANFKLGMVSLGPGRYGGSLEGDFGRMRVWQRDYSSSTPGWFYATGAHASSCGGDTVHIGGRGHADNGRREARSYLATLGVGVSGAGPRIISATRSGLDVTFTVVHSGGTALQDQAGGNGTALTGFRFFDAGSGGALIPYGSTAIVGPTQFRVTLNSAPVGVLTVDYAITDSPHGVDDGSTITYVPSSALCDNVALPNMVGCVLQPCAAMTVTGG